MKYRILQHRSTDGLELLVNDKIAQGWELHGSVSYMPHTGLYLQVVIKEEA